MAQFTKYFISVIVHCPRQCDKDFMRKTAEIHNLLIFLPYLDRTTISALKFFVKKKKKKSLVFFEQRFAHLFSVIFCCVCITDK